MMLAACLARRRGPVELAEYKRMPAVTHPAHKKGDAFVDYEEKVFEDVKANPGEKALVTFHTVASKDRSASSTCCKPPASCARASRRRSCSTGRASPSECSAAFPRSATRPFPAT